MDDLKILPVVFTALFPVLNPVGTSLIIMGLVGSLPKSRRLLLAKNVSFYSFFLISVFYFLGRFLLEFFGISIEVVQVAGGLVVALMGWKMLNEEASSQAASEPQENTKVVDQSQMESHLFYPFTFPLSMGPGALAVVMTLSAHIHRGSDSVVGVQDIFALAGFALVCIAYMLCLLYLPLLTLRLKSSWMMAISKIMAFFVLCIGAQIAWTGVQALH